MKAIDEFEKTYKPEFSIVWYKKDSFVYRLLNKVMRQQNIQGILRIRFFISDLFTQLKKTYYEWIDWDWYEDNSDHTVYRGQMMFTSEFDKLNTNLKYGTIISINSFFSASRDQGVALDFASTTGSDGSQKTFPSDVKPVLFEIKITIDFRIRTKRKPFADVSLIMNNGESDKPDELEVLFMVGSFFRIDEITENKEMEAFFQGKPVKVVVTLLKLTLIDEDYSNIPIMKDYQILKSTKTIEGKAIRIGNLLIDHSLSIRSQRSKADSYYQALSNEPKDIEAAVCLTGRAWVALKRGFFDSAIKLALQALSIDNKSNDELTITTLNCLGCVYSKLRNYPEALTYYRQAYDLSKPTDEKIVNNSYQGPHIPIDKHAMYDNYRNISSISIARIHQKRGDIQLAWDMYKEAIDCDMRDTTYFHCHTCMIIAESGTHQTQLTPEEHNRRWKNWKSFLDLGLVDMLKYRTPVITGYLSLSHQYDCSSRRYDNIYSRTMAIDYFQTVEKQCTPYVTNHDYYLYTLQCYERLAELYRHWDSRSLDYYEKMIRLCLKYHPNDLENIISGYQGMIKTYQQQQVDRPVHSENLSILLCADTNVTGVPPLEIPMTPPVTLITPPLTPLAPLTHGTLFQNIKHLDFAFECYDKRIDPRLKTESNLGKKRIYCHLKLAALYYDQGQVTDATKSLREVHLLSQQFGSELKEVRNICEENLSFIQKKFDFIIRSYKNRLSTNTNIAGSCMDENNYSYIARLYQKEDNFNSALEFLKKPAEDFERYNYVCIHTIDCFLKLTEYYQMVQYDKELTIRTYERAIDLVKKHRPDSMITTISIIEEHLIDYSRKVNDEETIVDIYQALCDIAQRETTDILVLYRQFKHVLKLLIHKPDLYNAVLNAYDAFLEFILQIISPLTSQMSVALVHFRDHSVHAYKKNDQLLSAIEVYQKLIYLLFHHQNNTIRIEDEYKKIAAEFLSKHLLEDSVTTYENLLDFACQHPIVGHFVEDDLITSFVFYIWTHRIIDQYLMEMHFDSAINLHYKMIRFLENYRINVNPEYHFDTFISTTLENYDQIARIYQLEKLDMDQTINTYQEQIDFLTKYETGTISKRIEMIVSECQQFAKDHREQAIEMYSKLVVFLEKNRLQYLPDLSIAYNELEQLNCLGEQHPNDEVVTVNYFSKSCRVKDLQQRISDYKEKAKQYLDQTQFDKANEVYRNELLPFLLENHARDDEQIATCYRQMASLYYEQNALDALNYYQKAIDMYQTQEASFYTEEAFQLNPNVYRRYAGTLFMCYRSLMIIYIALKDEKTTDLYREKMNNIYEKHQDQFQSAVNPDMDGPKIEIRAFVELGY